jgi:hypothetical protein
VRVHELSPGRDAVPDGDGARAAARDGQTVGAHPAELLLHTLRLRGGPPPEELAVRWVGAATPDLRRLVEAEGCALWLQRRLHQIAAVDVLPADFRTWLGWRARDDAARNLLVDEQVTAVLRDLAADGIPHILLKGAARRASIDLFPFADARATRDVDVLLPSSRAEEAWQRLRRRGYEIASRPDRIRRDHFHLPALWDRSRVAVELHTSTSLAVPSEEAWCRTESGAREIVWNGVPTRVPAATELLWHGLTHSLDQRSDTFRLRLLLDGAAVFAGGAALAWPTVLARLDCREVSDRASAIVWLRAAAWLAGAATPAEVAAGPVGADLGRAWRWRCAVLRILPPHARVATLLVREGTRRALRLGPGAQASRLGPLAVAAARAAHLVWGVMSR